MFLICYDIHIEHEIPSKDFFDIIYYAFICSLALVLGSQVLHALDIFSLAFLIFLGPLGLLIFYLVIVTIIIVIIVRIRRHKKV